MSIINSIETEFAAIINDSKTVSEKLAALVGLHNKSQELTALEPTISLIIADAEKPIADKVSEILSAVGKL